MEVVEPTPYDVLIEQCKNPNVEGAYERAQEAIRQGADVNRLFEFDGMSSTPILKLASSFPNNPNFIQLLLDAGANPNIYSGYGNVWTPLSSLAHKEYHEKFSRGENNDAAKLAKNNALYEHKKVKAMLNFTKGEGFGRPLLEFSLTGKPILVSNWSGHIDFLKQGAVLLEGELKPVHESAADQFLLKESQWFNVNISKALVVIKDVYKNYDKYKTASFQLGKQNKQNFSLEKMTKLFDTILNQYGIYTKIQPKFQQLQLPKLKMLNK